MEIIDTHCDLLIIGGGINGAGIAANAAGCDLKVILCEKDDIASHTSSASSKLIHGGLRYLEQYHFNLVRKAIKERDRLLSIAPHLIHPLEFVLPLDKSIRSPLWIRLGLFIYDNLAKSCLAKTKKLTRKKQGNYFTSLNNQFNKAYRYYDAMTDDARLVIANAKQAEACNATILTHTKFINAHRYKTHWNCILEQKNKFFNITAKVLINASGPWVDKISNKLSITTPYHLRLIKGSHIITSQLYEGSHAYILQNTDKRIIFTIPYLEGFTLIGTTDLEVNNLDNEKNITPDEITYLQSILRNYFKKTTFTSDSIISTWSGVRPLLYEKGKSAKNITRDYKLHLEDSYAPIINIFGGKITTYRKLSVEAMQLLKKYFPNIEPHWTDNRSIFGGEFSDFAIFLKEQQDKYHWLENALLKRYCKNYGTKISVLLKGSQSMDDLGRQFGFQCYQKEVDYLINNEWAKTSDDILFRRTKLGLYFKKEERLALESYLNKYK